MTNRREEFTKRVVEVMQTQTCLSCVPESIFSSAKERVLIQLAGGTLPIDEDILPAIHKLNRVPGIMTLFCCSGHEHDGYTKPHVMMAHNREGEAAVQRLGKLVSQAYGKTIADLNGIEICTTYFPHQFPLATGKTSKMAWIPRVDIRPRIYSTSDRRKEKRDAFLEILANTADSLVADLARKHLGM